MMGSSVILHWIPSHIEITTRTEKLNINGNDIADKLANKAARSSDTPVNYNFEYIALPRNLTELIKHLVYNIDRKINKAWERSRSQNAGPSCDDFSSWTDAQQILGREPATP